MENGNLTVFILHKGTTIIYDCGFSLNHFTYCNLNIACKYTISTDKWTQNTTMFFIDNG